jgi:hypothetical protein
MNSLFAINISFYEFKMMMAKLMLLGEFAINLYLSLLGW